MTILNYSNDCRSYPNEDVTIHGHDGDDDGKADGYEDSSSGTSSQSTLELVNPEKVIKMGKCIVFTDIQWHSQLDSLVLLCKFQIIIFIHLLFSQSMNTKNICIAGLNPLAG